jgi:acetolactate synthase-1/2/3 large subunit
MADRPNGDSLELGMGSGLSASTTIASHAVAVVTTLGADTLFCLTGGMAMHLNRAAARQPGLKVVYCQHEQAAVAAAEGYAKASDFRRPGFAMVTAGPGVSNAVTSLLSANGDSVPLIVLAGQIKREDINPFGVRTHGIQETPSKAIVEPCVKRFLRLELKDWRSDLVEALTEAFVGRPGVVFIEIPLDVQGAPIELSADAAAGDAAAVLDKIRTLVPGPPRDLLRALEDLVSAKRPLLYVGNGVRIAGIETEVRRYIELHDLPAVFSWLSFDILPADHELNFGCPGGLAPISANRILGQADRILFLGARLDLGTTAFQRAAFGGQAERILVDVDGAELSKFAGLDGVQLIEADLRSLRGYEARGQQPADPQWVKWCQAERAGYIAEEKQRLGGEALTIYAVAERLSAWSSGKVFVPASSGYAEETLTRFFRPGEGARFFNGAALGAMGFGLPMALGAAFASEPDGIGRQTICIDADGGLMLNIQELATLRQEAPPGFVLFVMNNDGYESIRSSQARHFGEVFGADAGSGLFIPPLDRLAGAFGLPFQRIETLGDLDRFLAGHPPTDPPVVVELVVPPSEPRGPGVRTVIGKDGRPMTTSLAEIDW